MTISETHDGNLPEQIDEVLNYMWGEYVNIGFALVTKGYSDAQALIDGVNNAAAEIGFGPFNREAIAERVNARLVLEDAPIGRQIR